MNVIFLGPPGSGKGTIASKITKELNIPHISTGDLFRAAIKAENDLGLKIKSIIEAGNLVPDEVTIEVVKRRLEEDDTKDGYILDGFPRTPGQAEALANFSNVDAVIDLNLNDEELIKRLSGRRVCKQCGNSFHVDFVPPKTEGICDDCGGELYTRKDDQLDSIKNRLEVYYSQTEPLKQYYSEKGIILTIDASPAPKEVLAAVLLKLKK
ncbi:MAG: adenylate kinase [Spirochaetaceae bacterium 4572_7]|nr:MAG: adenylate kinase [Spirochaetaceae bacterium 4572_7]